MEDNYDRFIVKGMSASGLLLAFYWIVASLLGGFSFAIENFVGLWYFMIPLIVGFGVQIGMFFYVKEEIKKKATVQAAASTGVSSVSMIACCAHHIADIAPFLGITALGLFLTKYQSTFLLMGVLSNVLGILYMASLMGTRISKAKMKALFYSLLVLSIVIVAISYFYIPKTGENASAQNQDSFQTLDSNKNNVEFRVTPLSFSEFQISMDTHSVDMNFDLTQISTLYDDAGNAYKPSKWEGSGPGGHHRSGILKFPSINSKAKSAKLVIIDTATREFEWKLE